MVPILLDDKGLVPAIIQHALTGDVLMLGYMNPDSLARTIDSKQVWFYSRSRAELWHKGDTSGNYMHVKSIAMDCDGDTVLVKVEPDGPACHTGNPVCFFTPVEDLPEFTSAQKGPGVIDELFAVIQDRKLEMPEGSYTAKLLDEGVERISQKVIEEAGEVAITGVKADKEQLACELADLVYHALVLVAASGGKPEDVYQELRNRRNG